MKFYLPDNRYFQNITSQQSYYGNENSPAVAIKKEEPETDHEGHVRQPPTQTIIPEADVQMHSMENNPENDTSVLLSALADARELCYENA